MKKYGLQIRAPIQKKQSSTRPPIRPASIFAEEEDEDVEKKISRHASKTKAIEEQQKKALEEDPCAFSYDDMKQKDVLPRIQDREQGKEEKIIGGDPSSLPLPYSSCTKLMGYTRRTFDFESPVNRARFHNPSLLRVYAMAGLHRYNFLSGTNWVFDRLKKVVIDGSLVYSYSITCYASQGQGGEEEQEGEEKAFYIDVCEQGLGSLNIAVPIAKPLEHPDDLVDPDPDPDCSDSHSHYPEKLILPEWPCDFVDRDSSFLKLTRAEWLRCAWVSLYLHLALCRSDRYTEDQLNQIEILDVVIETYQAVSPDEETLQANKATLYIRYKDFDQAQRKAVIARDFDPNTGDLRLRASSGLTPQVVGLRHYNPDLIAMMRGHK